MTNLAGCLLLAAIAAVSAAPLVHWSNVEQSAPVAHNSRKLKASSIFGRILRSEPQRSSLSAVVFLLGRGEDGSESFSTLAEQGSIPGIAEKVESADTVNHHVSGILNAHVLARDASAASSRHNVLEVSVDEYFGKLSSPKESPNSEVEVSASGQTTSKRGGKRARAIASANVLVVKLDPSADPAGIDHAVVAAIEHDAVENVVLTGVRSVDEVKEERVANSRRRLEYQRQAGRKLLASANGRRRLEDEQQEEGNADDAAQDDGDELYGIYYVSMTPNIFAGILFTFMFAVVTWIAVSCMNMIVGQDVYVSKMPYIGREA